jgi:hypothetical protein
MSYDEQKPHRLEVHINSVTPRKNDLQGSRKFATTILVDRIRSYAYAKITPSCKYISTPRKNVIFKDPESLQQLSLLIELDQMHMKCHIHMFGFAHRLEYFLEDDA